MVLAPRLDVRQTQSLTMTPQLMQSIRLLQMTHAELEQFIDTEVEKNPLLERIEAANDDYSDRNESSEAERGGDSSGSTSDDDWFGKEEVADSERISETFDSSLENIYPDDPGVYEAINPDLAANWKSASGDGYVAGEGYDIDQLTANKPSLSAHIAEQISLSFGSVRDRFIATALADTLDESGYLRADIALLAQRIDVEVVEVERILSVLQTFDPYGVFARDLSECLAIQLRLKDRFDPAMQQLLENLDLLAKRDFTALTKICGVGQSDILDMLVEIQNLDPKPGAQFEVDVAEVIVPDVIVSRSVDDGWLIELNPAVMPRLIVNNEYYAEVSKSAKVEDRNFMSDCMQTANWLTRSLDQRARTILKVVQEIVRQQDGFLRQGVKELKPLNLKAIAEAVGMHESTISRVTANKFVQTPRGVFELRYFFTASLGASDGGEAHSAESVRHRIRQLIDAETANDVLSDDALVDILKGEGVDIARRTVAKYRESMNISSSVQRRREKKARQQS